MSPPNVLITKYGEVKIVDFGLAKATRQLEKSEPGIIKGKFSYLSPEAALGQERRPAHRHLRGRHHPLGDARRAAPVPRRHRSRRRCSRSRRRRSRRSRNLKDVPAELEQIIGHALARDPEARYQSAREFGRDLNRVLFQMGRPVSSFDLGSLVTDVRDEQRRQRGARPKQQTLIGNLIQDAMMSFTSLTDDEESDAALDPGPEEQSGVGAIPLSFGTFEGSQAVARLPTSEPSQVNLSPPGGYEAGNLAALEDQGDGPLHRRGTAQPASGSVQSAPLSRPARGGALGAALAAAAGELVPRARAASGAGADVCPPCRCASGSSPPR